MSDTNQGCSWGCIGRGGGLEHRSRSGLGRLWRLDGFVKQFGAAAVDYGGGQLHCC